ncbi:hypothetical protein [Bifidobacterium oedipodis]|uniref:Uncharacterized protein n=1 Tax=Bifidobacterium oedipodis TaxID=2675322 RepID=A0A7Y0EPP4_9BIFI|nr:hypothetical protein [Bifidobacterium sp. DSM 109957]NMM94163.1 hypothetical protein [Bifidobacterium sp. DSM 109957]
MSRNSRALRKANNELEHRVKSVDEDALTNITVYLRSSNLTTTQQELVRRDIITMLIDGEGRGQTAASILGKDYRAFCDEIIAAVPHMSLTQRILRIAGMLSAALAVACVCLLSVGIANGYADATLPIIVLPLGAIIQYAIFGAIAILLVWQLTRHAFDIFGSQHASVHKIVVWIGYGIGVVAGVVIAIWLREPVLHMHVLVGVLIVVAVSAIAIAIDCWED